MNTIDKDKIPTLNTLQSRTAGAPQSRDGGEGRTTTSTESPAHRDDSLSLSTTGKLLNQPAAKAKTHRSSPPETAEQAESLAATIRQQFANNSAQALNAYSLTSANNLENLLSSAPA